jgi:hypothetical protein
MKRQYHLSAWLIERSEGFNLDKKHCLRMANKPEANQEGLVANGQDNSP